MHGFNWKKTKIIYVFGLVGLIIIIIIGATVLLKAFSVQTSIEGKTEKIVKEAEKITKPLSPRVADHVLESQKQRIAELHTSVDEKLKNGEFESAKNDLLVLKDTVMALGDVTKSDVIPEELKNKHDPQGQYIDKFDLVDPAILPEYLLIIDALVELDKKISSK